MASGGLMVRDCIVVFSMFAARRITATFVAYLTKLHDAEARLTYKSIKVEPVVDGRTFRFDIQNVGNVYLELLMLEAYARKCIVEGSKIDVCRAV
jgi:hypothetical protein